nr:immunoglobulin heavy chain junction region [Macaca mulatta]MOW20062.1 immunoglobulin heavy chain junction region [Macaca mulatta]MOW20518.1 immunoglobulin heavy chain junction region [Macaca mulatta]MOW20595.1 immunoglobulin heavy chain junction region [Macaca mulatta]MOW20871.1 immunoglobulin heavy chain junction region [Macaca mulatta]
CARYGENCSGIYCYDYYFDYW